MQILLWSADEHMHKSTYCIVDRLIYGFPTCEEGLEFVISADSESSKWRSLYSVP